MKIVNSTFHGTPGDPRVDSKPAKANEAGQGNFMDQFLDLLFDDSGERSVANRNDSHLASSSPSESRGAGDPTQREVKEEDDAPFVPVDRELRSEIEALNLMDWKSSDQNAGPSEESSALSVKSLEDLAPEIAPEGLGDGKGRLSSDWNGLDSGLSKLSGILNRPPAEGTTDGNGPDGPELEGAAVGGKPKPGVGWIRPEGGEGRISEGQTNPAAETDRPAGSSPRNEGTARSAGATDRGAGNFGKAGIEAPDTASLKGPRVGESVSPESAEHDPATPVTEPSRVQQRSAGLAGQLNPTLGALAASRGPSSTDTRERQVRGRPEDRTVKEELRQGEPGTRAHAGRANSSLVETRSGGSSDTLQFDLSDSSDRTRETQESSEETDFEPLDASEEKEASRPVGQSGKHPTAFSEIHKQAGMNPGHLESRTSVRLDASEGGDLSFISGRGSRDSGFRPAANWTVAESALESGLNELMGQMVSRARLGRVNQGFEFGVQLKPEFLGHLRIKAVLGGDGKLHAVISAEDNAVRQGLEHKVSFLTEKLQQEGIQMDGIKVENLALGSGMESGPHEQGLGREASGHERPGRGASIPAASAVEEGRVSELSVDDGHIHYYA